MADLSDLDDVLAGLDVAAEIELLDAVVEDHRVDDLQLMRRTQSQRRRGFFFFFLNIFFRRGRDRQEEGARQTFERPSGLKLLLRRRRVWRLLQVAIVLFSAFEPELPRSFPLKSICPHRRLPVQVRVRVKEQEQVQVQV